MTLTISSDAIPAGGSIPARYTCDGADISPPLAWSGVPAAARSLVLIMDDPDAPDPAAPQRTWVHWVVFNLDPQSTGLVEGAATGNLPGPARTCTNDWKKAAYGGACPPIGRHRYFHKLYALDVVLPDHGHPTKAELERLMRGHVIAQAELIGTYQRTA